jgi:hypothetical protein
LALKKGHRLRVFERRVLEKISGFIKITGFMTDRKTREKAA